MGNVVNEGGGVRTEERVGVIENHLGMGGHGD
jgi:hypothetical protein